MSSPKKNLVVFIALILSMCLSGRFEVRSTFAQAESADDSDQQIGDFSLAGYGERGKKTWDLSGKTADIFENTVKLKDLTGNLYGKEEDVKLTAKEGDFDRSNGRIHVEKDVVITTSSGAKLTTDSLDWDRSNSVVSTDDVVNITRQNLFTRGRGARGEMALNKMNLEEEVLVEFTPEIEGAAAGDSSEAKKIVITCDGPLEIDYQKNVAIFNNNVKVDREDSQIYSEIMELYFSSKDTKEAPEDATGDPMIMGNQIDKIIARHNVKTVRGDNITYSEEAVYSVGENKVILSGRPKLLIYSTDDFQAMGQ
ncbi:MAG: LPS export ABC transporter periplasmic protein LptC [Candidatus Omnitrophica bacterium]|nr:LPS export ABC transporter periplasmic protein LptC [Candidatus Omnitrophota bacterium]